MKKSIFLENYKSLNAGSGKGFAKSTHAAHYLYVKNKIQQYKERTKDKSLKLYAKSKERDAVRKMTKKFEQKTSDFYFQKEFNSIELIEFKQLPFFAASSVKRSINPQTGKLAQQMKAFNVTNKKTLYSIKINVNEDLDNAIFLAKSSDFLTANFNEFQAELQRKTLYLNTIQKNPSTDDGKNEINVKYENIICTYQYGQSDNYFLVEYNYDVK